MLKASKALDLRLKGLGCRVSTTAASSNLE